MRKENDHRKRLDLCKTFSIVCSNPLSWNLRAEIDTSRSHGVVLSGGWISLDLDAFYSQKVEVYV